MTQAAALRALGCDIYCYGKVGRGATGGRTNTGIGDEVVEAKLQAYTGCASRVIYQPDFNTSPLAHTAELTQMIESGTPCT
jgi:hypothetical protein